MTDRLDIDDLNEKARQHLWMHFTRLGSYQEQEIPIIARGKGCYLWDAHDKRYLDALSGLFTVQLGHGREDLAAAAQQQASTLEYFPIWSYAAPARDRARRDARRARARRSQPRVLHHRRLGGRGVGMEAGAAVLPRQG